MENKEGNPKSDRKIFCEEYLHFLEKHIEKYESSTDERKWLHRNVDNANEAIELLENYQVVVAFYYELKKWESIFDNIQVLEEQYYKILAFQEKCEELKRLNPKNELEGKHVVYASSKNYSEEITYSPNKNMAQLASYNDYFRVVNDFYKTESIKLEFVDFDSYFTPVTAPVIARYFLFYHFLSFVLKKEIDRTKPFYNHKIFNELNFKKEGDRTNVGVKNKPHTYKYDKVDVAGVMSGMSNQDYSTESFIEVCSLIEKVVEEIESLNTRIIKSNDSDYKKLDTEKGKEHYLNHLRFERAEKKWKEVRNRLSTKVVTAKDNIRGLIVDQENDNVPFFVNNELKKILKSVQDTRKRFAVTHFNFAWYMDVEATVLVFKEWYDALLKSTNKQFESSSNSLNDFLERLFGEKLLDLTDLDSIKKGRKVELHKYINKNYNGGKRKPDPEFNSFLIKEWVQKELSNLDGLERELREDDITEDKEIKLFNLDKYRIYLVDEAIFKGDFTKEDKAKTDEFLEMNDDEDLVKIPDGEEGKRRLELFEKYLKPIKEEFQEDGYDRLIDCFCDYFEKGAFPLNNSIIKLKKYNKKKLGYRLKLIHDNSNLDTELSNDLIYLNFIQANISLFSNDNFDQEDVLNSNFYRYLTQNIEKLS